MPISPPDRVGCYERDGSRWLDVPCVSGEEHRRRYPDADIKDLGALDVKKYILKDDKLVPRIAWASSTVNLLSIGSAADAKFGPGSWSVQSNTNAFNGTNSHMATVQFYDMSQDDFGDEICIGQVDMTIAMSATKLDCIHAKRVDKRRLQTGDRARIIGRAYVGKTGKHLLSLTVSNSWTYKQTDFAIVVEDQYGLHRRWKSTTGSILGFGNGSTLTFDKGVVSVDLEAIGCWPLTSGSIPNCKTGYPLKNYALPWAFHIATESNNLVAAKVALPGKWFWNAPDYASRRVIYATPGACLAAVTNSKGKVLAC